MHFPDQERDVVEYFLWWLYHSKLPDSPAYDDFHERISILAKLRAFGDANDLPELQNLAMKTLHMDLSDHTLDLEVVRLVYDRSRAGSPLRRIFVAESWPGRESAYS